MLRLKRNLQPYTWERCHITGNYIQYGEYYLQDDEDGLVICLDVYADMKRQKQEAEWDYSRLNNAANAREYEERLKEMTRQYKASTLMDRKVDKGVFG